jgi:hypothetical protein
VGARRLRRAEGHGLPRRCWLCSTVSVWARPVWPRLGVDDGYTPPPDQLVTYRLVIPAGDTVTDRTHGAVPEAAAC